jgi:hypothetical protein
MILKPPSSLDRAVGLPAINAVAGDYGKTELG